MPVDSKSILQNRSSNQSNNLPLEIHSDFSAVLVVTGATDGIGKAYALEV